MRAIYPNVARIFYFYTFVRNIESNNGSSEFFVKSEIKWREYEGGQSSRFR